MISARLVMTEIMFQDFHIFTRQVNSKCNKKWNVSLTFHSVLMFLTYYLLTKQHQSTFHGNKDNFFVLLINMYF